MDNYTAVRLTFRGGAITGVISGKIVQCFVRPAQAGLLPAAGEYRVAPVDDLIYGRVAVMVPLNGGIDPGVAEECIRRLPPPGASTTLFNPTGGRPLFSPGGIAEMTKQEMPSGAGALFVLTSRPIAGRNCLIVTSTTFDLFGAIAPTGGAVITVS